MDTDIKRSQTVDNSYENGRTISRGLRSQTSLDQRAVYKRKPVYSNMRSASTTAGLMHFDKKNFRRPKLVVEKHAASNVNG